MKGFSIILLILTFFAFVFYQTQKSTDFKVLKINSPTKIIIDLNKNGVEDNNETITLDNIQSFSTKPSGAQAKLARQIKISDEDALGLGFLAENFAKETLLDKNVKVKEVYPHVMLKQPFWQKVKTLLYSASHSRTTMRSRNEVGMTYTIIIDNKNYENLLFGRGFALFKGKAPSPELSKNIEKVRKLNLRIFNNKSNKYHKLNCKYGLIAHNSQIILASQLPKDTKPCKFCFGKGEKAKSKRKMVNGKWKMDLIPDIKSPATEFKTDSIKVFLTDFTKVLKPDNSCDTPVCKTLVHEINSAQSSIDFAIYGYTKIPALENALLNAQKRGVKVRFVYDSDENKINIYPDTLYLAKTLTNNNTDYLPSLMHDKFFIFDNKTVLTGSANISNTDMSGFNSNAVVLVNSEKMADIYSQEFEQMYEGYFHKTKHKIKNKEFEIGSTDFQVYFSPKDKGISAIIPLIDNSQKYVYIPAFLITQKQLAQSLINASERGVSVKIILDATNTHSGASKLKILRQSGIQVKTENLAGKLHSKSIIIDDLYTVIGSMNFSRSGEGENDENLLIIKNAEIAKFYKTFFQYLWKRIPDKWLIYNARAESSDSIGSCSDGIDNDFDGKIDKADDSCKMQRAKGKR